MPSDAENASSEAPEEAASEETSSEEGLFGPRPLSRNASRALVIGSILFVLAVSAGGTWLILDLARSGPPPQEAVSPTDTSDTSAAPAP